MAHNFDLDLDDISFLREAFHRLDENLEEISSYKFDDLWGPKCLAANEKYVAIGDYQGHVRFYQVDGDFMGKVRTGSNET